MMAALRRFVAERAGRVYARLAEGLRFVAKPTPEPLVVRTRFRRRTVDLLTQTWVELDGIKDAVQSARRQVTGVVLSTSWALVEKAPPVPHALTELVFDPDDVLELTIVLERRQ